MSDNENREDEIQAWLDQVHFGSCCSDDPEECDLEKNKKPSEEDSGEYTKEITPRTP